jgi:hypothetical protein
LHFITRPYLKNDAFSDFGKGPGMEALERIVPDRFLHVLSSPFTRNLAGIDRWQDLRIYVTICHNIVASINLMGKLIRFDSFLARIRIPAGGTSVRIGSSQELT